VKKPSIQIVLNNAGGFVEDYFEMVIEEKNRHDIYKDLIHILKEKGGKND